MAGRVKEGVVPMPPGWAFPTENPIVWGHTYETLVQELVKYRLANGILLGDPEEEIETDLCNRQNDICRPQAVNMDEALERDEANARTALDQVRLASKLFAHNRGTRWKELETKETAEKRASICQNCDKHETFASLTSCSPCVSEMTRQSTMISQGQTTSKNLGWCSATFGDLRSMVWLPKEGLERQLAKKEGTPQFCWLRQIQ